MPVEVWTNDGLGTMTAGGNNAPAAGTTQTWTVTTTNAFPAASNTAVPATQFYICDPLAETEKIAVTNVSGTTWSVTRGADGTTPVSHALGCQVVQVSARGTFWALAGIPPSGDSSGVTDAANMTAALAGGAQRVLLQAGTFYVNSSVALASGQRLIGAGNAATIVNNVGNAIPAFTAQGIATPTSSQSVEISGMTIDGTSATGAAEGIRAGDITRIRTDVIVRNFPSGAGIHLLNQSFWTEQASITATVHNCGTGVILDAGSVTSHSSFERTDIDIFTDLTADQFGITWQGGQGGVNQAPLLLGGRLRLRGNHIPTAGGTGALINMSVVPYSRMQFTQLDIAVETDAGGATAPQTMRFKDATCLIDACYGSIQFLNGGGGNWQASNNSFNFGLFNGFVTGDTTLQAEPKITEATLIVAGFPGTITGQVLAYQPRVDGLVFIGVNLSIPNGTVLTNNTTTFVAALPSWAFMTHHQQAIECDLAGVRVPLYVTAAGSLIYGGPTQTLGSTQTLTGQAMITNTNFPW